jgi:hypothetical protein
VNGPFGVDPAAARTAHAEMAIDEGAIRVVDVSVDVRGDEGVDAPAIWAMAIWAQAIWAKVVWVKAVWHGVLWL